MKAAGNQLAVIMELFRFSLRLDRRESLSIMLLVVLRGASAPASALSISWVAESAYGHSTVSIVCASVASGVAFALSYSVSRIQVNLQEDMSRKLEVALQERLYTAVAAPSTLSHIERPDYADRVDTLSQSLFPLANYAWKTAETISSVLALAVSVAILVRVDPRLAVLALLAAGPLIAALHGHALVRRAKVRSAELRRYERAVHAMVVSPFSVEQIRVAGSGPELDRRATAAWNASIAAQVKEERKAACWSSAGWLIFVVGLAGAVLLLAAGAPGSATSVRDMVLVLTLSSQLKGQISAVVQGMGRMAVGGHLAELFMSVEQTAIEEGGQRPETANIDDADGGLVFDHVSYCYPGQSEPALRDVTLSIPRGRSVSVVGLNGSGKSTLLNLVLGLREPSSGSVRFDGCDVADLDSPSWLAGSTGVFQGFVKLHFRLREVVGLGDLSRMGEDDPILDALEEADALSLVGQHPDGLAAQLGSRFNGRNLSEGQWQKIAIARSLLRKEPTIAVYDEPSSALDPEAENELFSFFAGKSRELGERFGTVSLVVSHRYSSSQLTDHVIVLRDGRVVEQGTHDSLIAQHGEYYRLFEMQRRSYVQ